MKIAIKALFSLDQMQLMKLLFVLSVSLLPLGISAQSNHQVKIKKGGWIAELKLNNHDQLPFNLVVSKKKGIYKLKVENGAEMIDLNDPVQKGDSLYVRFPFFNSELVFTNNSKKQISGYWVNYNKGNDYKIPFSARKQRSHRFEMTSKKVTPANVQGRWEVTFEPNTNSAYPAVGVFQQKDNGHRVSGTFLTETGDYRYLDGNVTSDSMFLSCFDGSHAFLFKSSLENDTLKGRFLSGKHWSSEWIGKRNESFELTSPEELTYVVDNKKVEFAVKDLNGQDFSYPNDQLKNKVIIIQIMGTWCPNCLDETIFYKELHEKYADRGLEIISLGYEVGKTHEDYAKSIARLKDKLQLDFTFLVGGPANKKFVSEQFHMLNSVISFPTSIFIGRDGMVKRIHTGFNGPGTGHYYQEYVENTNSLIESLLAD